MYSNLTSCDEFSCVVAPLQVVTSSDVILVDPLSRWLWLEQLPLCELVRVHQQYPHWVELLELQRRQIALRCELTLLVGGGDGGAQEPQGLSQGHQSKDYQDPMDLIENSLLFCEQQQLLAKRSRLEPFQMLDPLVTQWLLASMPYITTLQLSVNFAAMSPLERAITLQQIVSLIQCWGERGLLELNIWFGGLAMTYDRQKGGELYSELADFWPLFNYENLPYLVKLLLDIQEEIVDLVEQREDYEGGDFGDLDSSCFGGEACDLSLVTRNISPDLQDPMKSASKLGTISLDLPVLASCLMQEFRFASAHYSAWSSVNKYGTLLFVLELASCYTPSQLFQLEPLLINPRQITQIGIRCVEEDNGLLHSLWSRFTALRKLSIDCSAYFEDHQVTFLEAISGLWQLDQLEELRIRLPLNAQLFADFEDGQLPILPSIKRLVLHKSWLRSHDEMNLTPLVSIFSNLESFALYAQLAQCDLCQAGGKTFDPDQCGRTMRQPLDQLEHLRKVTLEYGQTTGGEDDNSGYKVEYTIAEM